MIVVVMNLGENGKHYSIDFRNITSEFVVESNVNQNEQLVLPNRVLKAFTENAIDKILSKDTIPDETDMIVLDGYSYYIIIRKGNLTKDYFADDSSIETYPLLRYLASWIRSALK